MISEIFEQLIARQDLSSAQIKRIIACCMDGKLNDTQIGTFLALMRAKGETIHELTAAAEVMQGFAHFIDLGADLIDIVGTGGDGKNTFNVSTVCSFVVAAAGAQVAKHGNRSVSGRSGSADLLIEAGFELNLPDIQLQNCLHECGMVFLFAPHFHQAMQYVRQARQYLGIRTLFNLLGPLLNPAKAKKQVVGVCTAQLVEPIANVLVNLGGERILVLHSQDGLDEISIAAPTQVMEYKQGKFISWSINPKDYDCYHENLNAIVVSAPQQSLQLARSVFSGIKGPARDIVLLNSAAAIYCADLCPSFDEALAKASAVIDSGQALEKFMKLKDLMQGDRK
ncbi:MULTISPECIES: anthranilate phosphoribosyltransferase [Legionella]|uniref:anthranilate phosphoribosyltransferase n=1 Tax=Legionella TaxID=445 RepID=UPI000F8F287D|nr:MULTISPECIES: anthranilate phosphoribosyltransferase [Legionella]MCP0913590.1 anthranilate phosphoribosyltransferase [Legionella sp. 27cVA30]RUQ97463.1 anthranilate phosphoribosyltransferase [Legionella septentrionalis]RUR09759.1 anthranilate phosphoribosyltransferase [Legionella septentrionalis]RUR15949.1 anthranilate phosphoribosyltransferase [Legionella septentrionalis]